MGEQGAWAKGAAELRASLEQLPATARFQVICYSTGAAPLVGRINELVPATPDNLRRAAAALDALEPLGSTRHRAGLTPALNLRPDVLYFLTDDDDLGDDCSWATRINA